MREESGAITIPKKKKKQKSGNISQMEGIGDFMFQQEEPSTSVLSRYFEENEEETLDYELEPWDTQSEIDSDDRESVEEDDEVEAENSVLESGKEAFTLIRDDYKRKLHLKGKPTIVYSQTSTGYKKPGPIWKLCKAVVASQRFKINKHRTTSQDHLLRVFLPRKDVEKSAPSLRKKKDKLQMVRRFLIVKNENCGKLENLKFTFRQWHHFVVHFSPEVFAGPVIRLVEEIPEETSDKSCDDDTDALKGEVRSVRDLRITLMEAAVGDGTLECLFDEVCLTDIMFNKCQAKHCPYKLHHLGEEFEQRLSALSSLDSVKIAYQFMKKCYVFPSVYKSFIRIMARLKGQHFMAKTMIRDILWQPVIKNEVGIRRVILGLVSTGMQFYEAVHLVMQENDIADSDLNDSLLRIIALDYNIAHNWSLVHLLLQKRDQVPPDVAQILIDICIMQPLPNIELARNVIKDLVDRNLFDIGELNSSAYSELLILASDEHEHVPSVAVAAR